MVELSQVETILLKLGLDLFGSVRAHVGRDAQGLVLKLLVEVLLNGLSLSRAALSTLVPSWRLLAALVVSQETRYHVLGRLGSTDSTSPGQWLRGVISIDLDFAALAELFYSFYILVDVGILSCYQKLFQLRVSHGVRFLRLGAGG